MTDIWHPSAAGLTLMGEYLAKSLDSEKRIYAGDNLTCAVAENGVLSYSRDMYSPYDTRTSD